MIFAVAHSKGGVGKSHIASHLAVHLARRGPTLVINADAQQSITTWAAWRRQHGLMPMPAVRALDGRDVYTTGKLVAGAYLHTVIDAGGRDSAGLRATLSLAERLIVPTTGDAVELVELNDYLTGLVAEARQYNPALDYRVLGCRIDTASRDGDALLADLDAARIPHFTQLIGERRAYPRAWRQGQVITEYTPRNAAGTHEMGKLLEEIDAWASPPVPTT